MKLRTTFIVKRSTYHFVAAAAGCLLLAATAATPLAGQTRAAAADDAPGPDSPAPRSDRRVAPRRYEETVPSQDRGSPGQADDRRYDREPAAAAQDERRPAGNSPRIAQRNDDTDYDRNARRDDARREVAGQEDARAGEPRRNESRAAAEARAIDPRSVAPRNAASGNAATDPNNGAAGAKQTSGQSNAAGQPAQQQVMAAPFQLAPQQQQFVDELLAAWEKQSGGIKTFECDFTRWEYSPQFAAANPNQPLKATAISTGELKYVKPDKGLFHVKETQIWSAQANKYQKANDDSGEHWICDGKKVWELNAKMKQVMEYSIPPDMQGKQISDGPLPFMLFGGEAAKIKARYFMRERTAQQFAKDEIWFESYPKWQRDAANFRSAQLIMKRSDFLPYALRMYSPNGSDYSVFEFKNVKVNNVFFSQSKVSEPEVPRGWQLIRDTDKPAPQAAARPTTPSAESTAPRQAQRPQPERPAR